MNKYALLTLLFVWLNNNLFAQNNVPLGTWRDHSAYNKSRILEIVNKKIYCVSEHGLFVYDLDDNSIHILSKIDGFSDVTITAIKYNPSDDQIALGYDNGNIDLISGNLIENIKSIKNANVITRKAILDIEFHENYIYFITEFGVVLYSKEQKGIKETWQNLGENGQYLKLNQSSILRDTMYLATEKGVLAGFLDPGNNLLDYNNWVRYDMDEGIPATETRLAESFNNKLYVVQNDSSVFEYYMSEFKMIPNVANERILSMVNTSDILLYTTKKYLVEMDKSNSFEQLKNEKLISPNYSLKYERDYYIADGLNGMVHIAGNSSESIYPNGPFTNSVFSIYSFEGSIISVPGGYDINENPMRNEEGFNIFTGSEWENYNNSGNKTSKSIPEVKDLVDVIYNPLTAQLNFASYGYGILNWNLEDDFSITDENSPGTTLVNSNPPERFTLVSSITSDRNNTNWVSNYNSSVPLHNFTSVDAWNGYSIPSGSASFATKLIVLNNQDKWMIINPSHGGGILVYNEISEKYRLLSDKSNEGNLPSNNVTDIILDREEQVWITTDKGVAYYPFPYTVLDGGNVEVVLPVFNLGFLFKNERTLCITVDGGSRKWIGTDQGAWLFNYDGSKLIENFNVDNSPLLSNAVIDIEVNGVTGEVFFATQKGIVSYRSDATEPSETHSNVKIFPNPVTPGYNGLVGISGLTEFATVKITDITGNLIYETASSGGTASWNVRDYNGRRAAAGIYIVYSSNADGSDTYVGKIAVIN